MYDLRSNNPISIPVPEDIDTKMFMKHYGIYYQNYLPQNSIYVSVIHKGKTWHLFNVNRYPLGRVA